MARKITFTRAQLIVRLQNQLEQHAYPRLQMGLMVSLTGAVGWLFSYVLLHAGLFSMAWRYPLALGAAYAFFLFLLWLWMRTKVDDYFDLPDIDDLPIPIGSGSSGGGSPSFSSGGGGNFDGGGASGSFDDASRVPLAMLSSADSGGDSGSGSASSSSSGSGLGDIGDLGDADELVIPLIVVALAIGLAVASLYVVYMAPALFAELLVDSAFSVALYRKLRRAPAESWLSTALRRTALPFALTAVFLAVVGFALASYAPGAHTIGQAINYTAH